MTPVYSSAALLGWARQIAPDLHVAWEIVSGSRTCVATFTHASIEHRIMAADTEAVAPLVAERLRTLMGLPPIDAPDRQTALEQSIVMASLGGDVAEAERLTRELVMGRSPTALGKATSFGKAVT
jgi:hypothetical protein